MKFTFGPVKELAAIPEQFRTLYADKPNEGGEFHPLETHKGIIEAITGLNVALEKERKRPNVDLSALAEYGSTVDEIRTNIGGKLKELTDQLAAGSKVNVEKLKKEFADAHQGELVKLNKRDEIRKGQVYRLAVENVATKELVDAKGATDLLMPHIQKCVKVVEDGDDLKVVVVDQDGEQRFSIATGQPMTIKELVAEMKVDKRFARGFDSEAPDGGGMKPGGGSKTPRGKGGEEQPATSVSKIAKGLRQGRLHGAKTPNGMT